MRNDRISPRRGTWDLTTTEVIGEGGLEDALAGMTERAERKTRAGAITLTANKASGSGAGSNVIAWLMESVVVAGNLKFRVVNTHQSAGRRCGGRQTSRRRSCGKGRLTYGLAFSMDTRRRANETAKERTPGTAS